MSSNVKVFLLRNFGVLGKKGKVVEVNGKYAKDFLYPNKIAREASVKDTDDTNYLKEKRKDERISIERYLTRETMQKGKRAYTGKIPEFNNFFKNAEGEKEKITWSWYPTNRLNLLPYGPRYVKIKYKKQEYTGTFVYLNSLLRRRVKASIIVDGSNLGWYNGYPSLDPIFSLYNYLARDSDQFFFPVIWVFDNSFRRKLTSGEKVSYDEFKSSDGVKTVNYADKEIFQMAKKYDTRYLFSNDHFKEYHMKGFVRISMR